jgi:sporulation-control protein spo0M
MRRVEIVLSKEAFAPGERIDGKVVSICDKSFNCNRVTLALHGEEMSRIVHGSGKSSHVHMEKREHINEELELLGPCEVPEGDNVCDFSLVLPEHLPACFAGMYSHIEYVMKANIEIPRALDQGCRKTIYVQHTVLPLTPSENKGVIEHDGTPIVSVELEKDIVQPGQLLPVRFMVSGDQKFRAVRMQIITRESVAPNGNHAQYDSSLAEVYRRKVDIDPESWNEIALGVPLRCAPPFKTDLIDFTYWLKATLDIAWQLDKVLFMPLRFSLETHELDDGAGHTKLKPW